MSVSQIIKKVFPPILYALATALEQGFVKIYFSEMFVLVHFNSTACFQISLPKVRLCPSWSQFTSFMDINNRISCTDGVNYLTNMTPLYQRVTSSYVTVLKAW